jgi:hypothetical protein
MQTMFDFNLLMQLPAEVRESIYGYVFKSDKPIRPQLCDDSFHLQHAKFHDANTIAHDATFKLMSLTRASTKLREESLPVFYSANSFAIGNDTTTYLTWLESAGRLDWIRRVNFVIPYHSEDYAASVLWMVSGYDEQVEEHLKKKRYNNKTKKYFSSIPHLLREHPRYLTGGWSDLTMCVLFRMLSTSLDASTGSDCKRKIVLPVSNPSAFETDSKLRWLSTVTCGLGIELRLIEQPGSATLHNGNVYLQWNREYQKTDVVTLAGPEEGSSKEVMRRAKEQFPEIERYRRPYKSVFYRTPCFARQGNLTWYDMPTMGGGNPQ